MKKEVIFRLWIFVYARLLDVEDEFMAFVEDGKHYFCKKLFWRIYLVTNIGGYNFQL